MNTATLDSPKTTSDLRHGFTVISEGGKLRTAIKIRLNDECRNGHEDFSITADVDEKQPNGKWIDHMGGCCHDHILELRPDLAPFVALHLADANGVPMHAFANAFYWFAGFGAGLSTEQYHGGSGPDGKTPDECRRIFAEHIRATDEQITAIVAAQPRTKQQLQAVLEDMGFPAQWEGEAKAAISMLEQWTGKTFASAATRATWEPLSAEAREVIRQRRESGYYAAEQTAKRDAENAEKAKLARIAEIEADHARALKKLENQRLVALYFAQRGNGRWNVIYYDHTNTVSFNWSTCEKLVTRAQFNEIEATLDRSALPDGVLLEWKEKPTR